jgi:Ni/Co efflux regulator RcnB
MKSRTILSLALIASMGVGSLSFAQGYRQDRGDRQEQNSRYDRSDRGDRNNRGDNGRAMGNRDSRDWERSNDRRDAYSYGARGAQWHRGGRIPNEYRNRQYVVNDWRGHHLSAPPRGHQWVQVGSDYVLVAVATGIIAQLLLNQ